MVTMNQLVDVINKYNKVTAGLIDGSLDPVAVKQALQDIIDRKSPARIWRPPTWWRTPEQQLERARELWPDAILPEPPKEFMPETDTEVLLLHVPDSFRSLWDKVVPPEGYTKWADNDKLKERSLRPAQHKHVYREPVWIAFDPEHGRNKRPDLFMGRRTDMAASEVLSALIQFPDWPLTWLNSASTPSLSGYQLDYCGIWTLVVVSVGLYDGRLSLDERWTSSAGGGRSSPTVREC